MKYIVILVLLTIAATGLSTLVLHDNGLVSMVWGDWVVETSLSFLVAATVMVFAVIYLSIRFGIHLWNIPRYWRNRRTLKRFAHAQTKMSEGLLALEYGDWQKAERALIKSAKNSESGLVNYLSAAKMAHNQEALDRRDLYLEQAREEYPEAAEVIGLVEARLVAEKAPQRARAILEVLRDQAPKNATILAELLSVMEQMQDWSAIEKLLPQAKRLKAIDASRHFELSQKIYVGLIQNARDIATLEEIWQGLDKSFKADATVLSEYVEQRIGFGEEAGLVEMIEKTLAKVWHDRLIYQYGRITSGQAYQRLQVAEKWLKKNAESAVLYLTLGRLACRGQLWSRAHGYYRESLRLQPELETFHALATCYEQEGEEKQAALIYKEAMQQLEHKTIA